MYPTVGALPMAAVKTAIGSTARVEAEASPRPPRPPPPRPPPPRPPPPRPTAGARRPAPARSARASVRPADRRPSPLSTTGARRPTASASRRPPLVTLDAVRLLHTSDWHVGRSFHGAPLLDHQVTVLQAIVDVVRSEAVDLVVVAGDLYDRQLPPADAVDVMSWAVV